MCVFVYFTDILIVFIILTSLLTNIYEQYTNAQFQYLQRIQYSHTKFARKNDYTIVLKKERKKGAPFVASLLFKHDDEYGAIFSAVNKKSLHYIDVAVEGALASYRVIRGKVL